MGARDPPRPRGLERPEAPAFSEGGAAPLPPTPSFCKELGRGAVGGTVEPSLSARLWGVACPWSARALRSGSSGESRKEGGSGPGRDGKGSRGRSAEAPHPVCLDPLGFF